MSFVYDTVISVKVIDHSVYELPRCIENLKRKYLTWQWNTKVVLGHAFQTLNKPIPSVFCLGTMDVSFESVQCILKRCSDNILFTC